MKKIILPVALALAGIVLIAYPFFLSSGDIDLQIKPAGFIMPAAYKVYSNPGILGGRFNLFKAIIKNPGSSEIKNLKVQFKVPDLINEWTDIPAATNLLPGQTAVVTCFPDFPQSITERNTASKATANIRITYGSKGNPTERDEAFTFDITSVNDIVFNSMADQDKAFVGDMGENDVLYACMVASEDPIIKTYAAKIQGKVLCGEEGAGVGGSGDASQKDLDEKRRVMEGVYTGMLASQMHYSETETNFVAFGDGNSSETEHIRLPREIVSNNTGLCIELALLHASVYKAAGLQPVIFLIPGHAYPGIKVGTGYMAIEATGIGMNGKSMSPDQAYATGIHELGEFFDAVRKGDPRYKILDINQLNNQGFQEMELKTDPTVEKGMETNTANWPACFATYFAQAAAAAAATTHNAPPVSTNRPVVHSTPRRTSNWMSYSINSMGFSYPLGWQVYNRPVQQLPELISLVVSPNKAVGIESYHVNNAGSPQQAMAYIRSRIIALGENVSYSQTGVINNFVRFNGITYTNSGQVRWVGFFTNAGNGVDGIVVGTNGNASQAVLNQIINSIR